VSGRWVGLGWTTLVGSMAEFLGGVSRRSLMSVWPDSFGCWVVGRSKSWDIFGLRIWIWIWIWDFFPSSLFSYLLSFFLGYDYCNYHFPSGSGVSPYPTPPPLFSTFLSHPTVTIPSHLSLRFQ